MKKRYVKRLVRKITYFVLTIVFLSLITTMIVEKRLGKNTENTEATDFNGDPVTQPFRAKHIVPTKRRPRPPVQERYVTGDQSALKVDPHHEVTRASEKSFKLPPFELPTPVGEMRDWNNYAAMKAEAERIGIGEHGMPASITDENLKELESEMSLENGFNALLSDSISVNRSIPDARRDGCLKKMYLADLPTTSIILPFYNEHFSVLLRSLYSIINRTPPELLAQIIIVDDASDRENLKEQLDDYIEEHFKGLVYIVRLAKRTGLIGARLAGARIATGEVLVFFDSHIECNYNWLPPLLEPIAINPNISTCPIVDIIDHTTFAYSGGYQEGSRGAFDWHFLYKQLPVAPEDSVDKTKPYRNPIMMGGLFAIGSEFFWQLGGYDEGLDIWGAEQYELSFKIWMCGGMLLDVPCSRVAHIFRGPMKSRPSPRDYNFVGKNHKRVAEVWLDDYKQYIYMRDPTLYENLDPGDLTEQKAIREHLKCKSFQWYLEEVAPDLVKAFPPVPPPNYCSGTLQSLAFPQYCLDTMNGGSNSAVGLYYCAENKTHPQLNQFWTLSWYRDVRVYGSGNCLDVQDSKANATVWMWTCHNQGGNQFWYYERKHQWLIHGQNGVKCMEAVNDNGKMRVQANVCDASNEGMRWKWGFVNDTLLDIFYENLEMR